MYSFYLFISMKFVKYLPFPAVFKLLFHGFRTQLILDAYKQGFKGVVICKCPDENCRNIVGNTDLDRRANLFREILRSRGIDSENLRIVEGLRGGNNNCIHSVMDLYNDIKNNGGGN